MPVSVPVAAGDKTCIWLAAMWAEVAGGPSVTVCLVGEMRDRDCLDGELSEQSGSRRNMLTRYGSASSVEF
jgi:hypothetical protein